jgi:hypothetical protein
VIKGEFGRIVPNFVAPVPTASYIKSDRRNFGGMQSYLFLQKSTDTLVFLAGFSLTVATRCENHLLKLTTIATAVRQKAGSLCRISGVFAFAIALPAPACGCPQFLDLLLSRYHLSSRYLLRLPSLLFHACMCPSRLHSIGFQDRCACCRISIWWRQRH